MLVITGQAGLGGKNLDVLLVVCAAAPLVVALASWALKDGLVAHIRGFTEKVDVASGKGVAKVRDLLGALCSLFSCKVRAKKEPKVAPGEKHRSSPPGPNKKSRQLRYGYTSPPSLRSRVSP